MHGVSTKLRVNMPFQMGTMGGVLAIPDGFGTSEWLDIEQQPELKGMSVVAPIKLTEEKGRAQDTLPQQLGDECPRPTFT
jgi:hypothetical protein